MIRARKLANELNIELEIISNILGNKDFIHPNYKIDVPSEKRIRKVLEEAESLLKDNTNKEISNVEAAIDIIIKSGIEYSNNLNNYSEEFNEINEFEHQTESLIQNNGKYQNRKPKKIVFENQQIDSIFTDFEASSICLGTPYHLYLTIIINICLNEFKFRIFEYLRPFFGLGR